MHFIKTNRLNVFEQLQLEEALLRTDDRNWCLVNIGSTESIVLGISSEKKDHVIESCPLPIIKRYSGGGSVVVDKNTIFISFIFSKRTHDFSYPEQILKHFERFYKNAFKINNFHLRENDFAIGNYKCAGNAMYIKKDRWLFHSTFLWDYNEKLMNYLLYPPKTPKYRKKREHRDFLCKLNNHFPSFNYFISLLDKHIHKIYEIQITNLKKTKSILNISHRKSTRFL
jgi:lipoate---protein ligase